MAASRVQCADDLVLDMQGFCMDAFKFDRVGNASWRAQTAEVQRLTDAAMQRRQEHPRSPADYCCTIRRFAMIIEQRLVGGQDGAVRDEIGRAVVQWRASVAAYEAAHPLV